MKRNTATAQTAALPQHTKATNTNVKKLKVYLKKANNSN